MNLKTVLLYHVYMVLVVIAATASMVIELSFARDISHYVYHLNFFSVTLGLAAYVVAFILIWNKLAGPSWSRLRENKANPAWYVWMAAATLGTFLPYLINVLFACYIMADGSFDSINPGHLVLITIGFSVIYPVVRVICGALRKKDP